MGGDGVGRAFRESLVQGDEEGDAGEEQYQADELRNGEAGDVVRVVHADHLLNHALDRVENQERGDHHAMPLADVEECGKEGRQQHRVDRGVELGRVDGERFIL